MSRSTDSDLILQCLQMFIKKDTKLTSQNAASDQGLKD